MRFALSHVLTVSGNEAGSRYSKIASKSKRALTCRDRCVVLCSGSHEKVALEISKSRQWAGYCEIGETVAKHENGILPFQAKADFDDACQDTSPQVRTRRSRATCHISRSIWFSNGPSQQTILDAEGGL